MIYSERVAQVMSKYVFLVAALMVSSIAMSWNSPGDVPAAGSTAPTFKLVTNEGKEASLSDFKGKWVVLYFYPKDFTSGCTLEAHNFQRDLAKYEQANAVILGVSVDTAESHKSFSGIQAHAENHRIRLFILRQVALKIVGFECAAAGEIFRIKIEHHPLAFKIRQACFLTFVSNQFEGRSGAACCRNVAG